MEIDPDALSKYVYYYNNHVGVEQRYVAFDMLNSILYGTKS